MNFELNQYHLQTKHSYMSIRTNAHYMDWNNQPQVFKIYPDTYVKTKLNHTIENHKFIHFIAGLTAKKTYPGVEYYLRVNPSAGALYPNEIYFQVRDEEGLENGIYHYENSTSSLTLLQSIQEDGIEPYLNIHQKQKGFIFLISSPYYRSSWKYKNRAFRYCLLDSGHLLGSLEASTYLFKDTYTIQYDFDKLSLNKMFGFDEQEFFLGAYLLTTPTKEKVTPFKMQLPFINPTGTYEPNELIMDAYKNTVNTVTKQSNQQHPTFNFHKSVFEDAILKRRSIREFYQKSIKKEEFLSVMGILNQPITSDCDEKVDIYCVINRVQGMKLGLYKNGVYLKEGDFKDKAGYLCLEQILGKESAVTFFLTSTDKNYQALYQKAGIIGHRLYLASSYLNLGCTGIGAYYDDEVVEFLELKDTMVLYALAIGN